MRIRYIVLTLIALIFISAAAANAQTVVDPNNPPRIRWDHNGLFLTGGGFKLYIDAATTGVNQSVQPETGPAGFSAGFPALTPGNHTFSVTAFNTNFESGQSNVVAVIVGVVPAVPTNLRLARWLGFGRHPATIMVLAIDRGNGWEPMLQVFRGSYKPA